MKLGILETGKLTPELESKYGAYSNMFVQMLENRGLALEFSTFEVIDDQFPLSVTQCDAWLITGSRHGAYEKFSWIAKLEEFIRQADIKKVPMVGICFGHQLIAQALGGRVVKSEKGWGLGVNKYDVVRSASWMADADNSITVNAVHQDQVVELPENAQILASSEFCPIAMLAYGDHIFTVQPHPEFSTQFQGDLINARRGIAFDNQVADKGLASLDQPVQSDIIATWIINFLRLHS